MREIFGLEKIITLSPIENIKFYVPVVMVLTAVKGKECMALLDSGSVADLVLAKFVEGKIDSLPQDTCLCDMVVAFGTSLVAILT